MGLHPNAISVVMLMILELLQRGYRVCISTHSPQVLECVWAVRQLKEHRAKPEVLLDVFKVDRDKGLQEIARSVMEKDVRVFYFDRDTQTTHDISELEAQTSSGLDGWGGLSEFSSRVNETVARVVANETAGGER